MSYAISLAEDRKEGSCRGGMPTDEALSMIGVPADEWAQYRQELEEIR